jgi:hypothetical protein
LFDPDVGGWFRMKRKIRRPVLGLIVVFVIVIPDSAFAADLPSDVIALARAKNQFRKDTGTSANCACIETISRSVRKPKSGKFTDEDQVHLEVTQIGDREWFSWPGGDRFENDPAALVGQGLVSSGEFLTNARAALLNSAGRVRFEAAEEMAGRAALRYSFRIPSAFSRMTVGDEKSIDTVDEAGKFWIDAATNDLLQVVVSGENIPATSDIASVSSLVRFQYLKLSDSDARVLFPQMAETRMEFRDGRGSRNVVQFAQCRKYQGEASIVSGDAATLAVPPRELAPLRPLPGGLLLSMRLNTAIRPGMAAGEPIRATVDAPVRLKGVTLIEKGALARGRIRMLERVPPGGSAWAVSVEFNAIDAGGERYRFMAFLEGMGKVEGMERELSTTAPTTNAQAMVGGLRRFQTESTAIEEIPGVGSFFMNRPDFVVPEGTTMLWRTFERGR